MVTITATNLLCKIEGLLEKDFEELRGLMSYEKSKWEMQGKAKWSDPRHYLLTKSGKFLEGLLKDVIKWLDSKKIKYELNDCREILKPPTFEEFQQDLKRVKFTPRPYQEEAIVRIIALRNGMLHMATGGGKTIVMALSIYSMDKNTIILVNSKDLALQLRTEIAEAIGWQPKQIGIVGAGKFIPAKVTICMVQTLTNGSMGADKRAAIKKLCENCEVLFIDEAHHTQSDSYQLAIKMCKGAKKRVGFTATPITSKISVMRKGKFFNKESKKMETYDYPKKVTKEVVLKAWLGDIISSTTTADLIRMGYLSKPEITFIHNEVFFDGTVLPYIEEYDRCILKDEDRNRTICQIIEHHYHKGEQTIGFVKRIDHGEIIKEMLVEEFGIPESQIGWVSGQDGIEERSDKIASFKDGHMPILLGTVLNEGLNFFCHAGINCSGGDSDIASIQRLGRILRKPKTETGDVDTTTERTVKFYDFVDRGHPIFSKHSRNRRKLFSKEGHEIKTAKGVVQDA